MDTEIFLQNLRDLSLEDGKVYIQEHTDELSDHAAIGVLLAEEALRLLYSPFVSLKLAELLIFFGEYVQHTLSYGLGLKAKGDVLMMIEHHQAALKCLDMAGEEFLGLGDAGNWARSRISWIISAAWLGRVAEALQVASHSRDVFLGLGEYFWACIIDHNIAFIYEQVERYQDAHNLYETMLAIYPTLGDQSDMSINRAVAMAKVNHAINLACLGNFEQSYRFQQEAQASFIALEETRMIINSDIKLSDLEYTQG